MWTSSLAMVPNIVLTAAAGSLNATSPFNQDTDATFHYDSNGGTRKRTDDFIGGSTIVQAEDWASDHPNHSNGFSTSVRITHSTGGNRATETSESLGVWYDLSVNRTWPFKWPWSGPGNDISTYTVDISLDGGSTVHDSGILTFNAQQATP
jgi:hypothetical protein